MVYNQQLARYAVPFLGKYAAMTMLPSRSRTGAKTSRSQSMTITKTRRKKQYVRKSFKNMLYDNLAAKHCNGNQGRLMTHNTIYTLVPTALPVQGDGNSNRDGDAIVLCALKLNGFFDTDPAAGAYGYRIIVGFTGEEYSNTTFGSGIGASELFLPVTSDIVSDNGIINAKAFTVLHDEKFTVNSEIASTRSRCDYNIYVPLNNQKFYYQSATSALGKLKNLVVVVMGSVVAGSTGTTSVGGTTISWDFIFKNMS